jgi:hypothetical protein
VATHHRSHGRQVRRARCGGEDGADLAEVCGSEDGGGGDGQERRIDAAVIFEAADQPAPTLTASPGPISTVSPAIVQVVTPLSP